MVNLETLKKLQISVQQKVPLADYTTFRLGGLCPCLITCHTPNQLEYTIPYLIKHGQPFILIGGGSNLVVSDSGVDCFVVRYVSDTPNIVREGYTLIVSASTSLDALAHFAGEHGMDGLNYMTGIPGTVGGAVVGNAGAFGKQIGDVIRDVTLINPAGEIVVKPKAMLDFAYRDSALKKSGEIVVSVALSLKPGEIQPLLDERAEILNLRQEKHPDVHVYPCAGSFFRNVEASSAAERRHAAGWYLEQAGAGHMKVGGAVVFEKHANIIVKGEDGSAKDVYDLSAQMAEAVKNMFDINLQREVHFVGAFPGMPSDQVDVIW